MVQEISVSTWEECEDKLKDIRLAHTSRFFPLLFRGHSDSRWALDTTLERSKHKGMKFDDYYRIISSMRSEVETLTSTSWSIPTYPEVFALVQEYDKFSVELTFGRNPAYDYGVSTPSWVSVSSSRLDAFAVHCGILRLQQS